MPQEARIKLTSTNLLTLEGVCSEIKGIGEKNGIKLKGPSSSSNQKDERCYKEVTMWTGNKHMGQI